MIASSTPHHLQAPGDYWNPFEHGAEPGAGSNAAPARGGCPSGPVAPHRPGSTLITAPAGSRDPFMPPQPPLQDPQLQPPPVGDEIFAPAGQRVTAASGRIQTPEQLRQRFAGNDDCHLQAVAVCCPLSAQALHVRSQPASPRSLPIAQLELIRLRCAALALHTTGC